MKHNDNREKHYHRMTSMGFVVILFLILILCIIIPDKQISENENRPLQSFPQLTMTGILDGSVMKKFENYASDQIVGRDWWVELKNDMDIASGKKDNGSVYFGKDGYLFPIETEDKSQLNKNIQYTKDFLELARKENPRLRVSVLIPPTSSEVMADKLPTNAPVVDQGALLRQTEKALDGIEYDPGNKNKGNAFIKVLPALKAQNHQYIYYRTDHHWTTLGAYYAYKAWEGQIGARIPELSEFRIKTVSDAFYGTTYSKAVSGGIKPDVMERFDYKDDSNHYTMQLMMQGKTKTVDGLYDEQFVTKKDKYAYFLSGNNALTTIETGAHNGKKILIVKDSYAHCFIPFLVKDYETIYVVDMRYYKVNPAKLIQPDDITDLLVLYNIDQYMNDRNLIFLSRL